VTVAFYETLSSDTRNFGGKCQLHQYKTCNGSFGSMIVEGAEMRAFFHFFIMSSNLSGLGSGAVCSVDLRYLHPRDVVAATVVNRQHGQRQDDLLAIRMEKKRVNRKEQECVVFRSEAFSCEVHCVKRFVKVTTAAPPTTLFDLVEVNEAAAGDEEEAGVPTPRVR
jgi:hypothetical protein